MSCENVSLRGKTWARDMYTDYKVHWDETKVYSSTNIHRSIYVILVIEEILTVVVDTEKIFLE